MQVSLLGRNAGTARLTVFRCRRPGRIPQLPISSNYVHKIILCSPCRGPRRREEMLMQRRMLLMASGLPRRAERSDCAGRTAKTAALGTSRVGWVALLLILGFLAVQPFPRLAQAQSGGATAASGTRIWTDSQGEPHMVSDEVARLLNDPGVWWGEVRANPLFIPDRILDQIPMEQLPIPKGVASTLRASIHPAGSAESCSPIRDDEWGGIGTAREYAKQFNDVLANDQVAVIGKVVGIEHGYLVWRSAVATMVQLQVEEVIKSDGEVKPGIEVLYPILGGSITFQGNTVCSVMPGLQPFTPALGEKLYLMGISTIPETHLVQAGIGFPVNGSDAIEDVGCRLIKLPKDLTVAEVRALAHGASHAN